METPEPPRAAVSQLKPEQQAQEAAPLKANGKERSCSPPVGDLGVAELQAQFAAMRTDSRDLHSAFQPEISFAHLSDARPIHGLVDWSVDEWHEHLEANPEVGTAFLEAFLGTSSTSPGALDRRVAALACKGRMASAQAHTEWQLVLCFQNVCTAKAGGRFVPGEAQQNYLVQPLLQRYMFDRDFPLGMDPDLARQPWEFAVEHSGEKTVRHRRNQMVSLMVYFSMLGILIFSLYYTLRLMVGLPSLWTLAGDDEGGGTVQDHADPLRVEKINARTMSRGTVASCLQSFAFSLTVNAMLDKVGLIDQSTSTVFIGMTLGGTFGFLMDNMIGGDEGFREYLWSPQVGSMYHTTTYPPTHLPTFPPTHLPTYPPYHLPTFLHSHPGWHEVCARRARLAPVRALPPHGDLRHVLHRDPIPLPLLQAHTPRRILAPRARMDRKRHGELLRQRRHVPGLRQHVRRKRTPRLRPTRPTRPHTPYSLDAPCRHPRTRFEWAYPSGVEDAHGLAPQQWISGSTMVLATVIMNALYLVVETRTKVGERGINDPPVKLAVTMLTYFFLWMLQAQP